MKIIYARQAASYIGRMDPNTKNRVMDAIRNIPAGDIKPLRGYADGRQRLRVGKYRVVFKYAGESLQVLAVGSRGDIYK